MKEKKKKPWDISNLIDIFVLDFVPQIELNGL